MSPILWIVLLFGSVNCQQMLDYLYFVKGTYGKNITQCALERGLVNFDANFSNFLNKYGKNYGSSEEVEFRKGNFLYSLDVVSNANKDYGQGRIPYQLALNRFADFGMNENYFVSPKFINAQYVARHSSPASFQGSGTLGGVTSTLPTSFDWISRNAVTAIQNQGACGSCWIFASLAVVEGANAIANNPLVPLSVQQLMNCVRPPYYISDGCQGGTADDVYDFVQRFGVVAEQNYPLYSARMGSCMDVSGQWAETVTTYNFLPINSSDSDIMQALFRYGPVAAIINAGDREFMLYGGGVLTSAGSRDLYDQYNHYIAIVGWGTEGGFDYWLIKNSWGTDWGEQGYGKLLRGINNRGINTVVSWAQASQRTFNQTIIYNNDNNSASQVFSFLIVTCVLLAHLFAL